MSWTRLVEFRVLCEQQQVAVPEVVTRALDVLRASDEISVTPTPRVLEMSPQEVRDYAIELSIRKHASVERHHHGYSSGLADVRDQVWAEVREEITPSLDAIVEQLQPRFDEIVAPIVTGAQTHGFTYATSSDDVIRLGDDAAVNVWRECGVAWREVRSIARFRVRLSELFDVSPTQREVAAFARSAVGDAQARNWSVCFAAGSEWSLDEKYHIEARPSLTGLDWFAIASGGLRLNTPSEVRAKLVERAEGQEVQLAASAAVTPLVELSMSDDEDLAPLPTYPARKK